MHWRKGHESDSHHLKHSDLFDEKTSAKEGHDCYYEPIFLIEKMVVDRVKSREKPKGERRNFAWFKGQSKPLGLNVTNCETLAMLSGSVDTERWKGLTVQLYVDPVSRYPSGKTGPAIRIKPHLPKAKADTSPLAEVPAEARERIEGEQAERLEERESGQEG